MLQKAGGSFPLTADVNFGGSFGLISTYFTSHASTPATIGVLRLNKTDTVEWRNNANSADNILSVNSIDQLLYNGVVVGAAGGVTSITGTANEVIVSAPTGAVTLSTPQSIAITSTPTFASLTLTGLGTNLALVSNGSSAIATSVTTATELGFVSGVSSPIQTQINAIHQVPTGAMLDFAGTSAPAGWLLCDGSVVAQATYPALFSAIGSVWNTGGEGAGNFRLPDFRRRAAVGSGGTGSGTLGNAVGNTGGEETHTLITAETPSHNHDITHSHSVSDPNHSHTEGGYSNLAGGSTFFVRADTGGSPTLQAPIAPNTGSSATGLSVNTFSGNSGTTGGGGSHNNIQPSAIVLKIIKT